MDIEGIPDQGFDYLIGLLISDGDETSYHSFWAESRDDESQMWEKALVLIGTYPDAPIYHYGSYEPRALDRITRAYQVDCTSVKSRLMNINSMIFGALFSGSIQRSEGSGKIIGLHLDFV